VGLKKGRKIIGWGTSSVKQKQSTYHPVAAGSIVWSVCSVSKTACCGNGRKTKEKQKQ